MKLFRLFAIVILFVAGISPTWAAEDSIAPTKISFDVVAGESFSYDLTYRSGSGGIYDLFTRTFKYDEQGGKIYRDAPEGWVVFQENPLSFDPEEEKYIPLEIHVPEESSDQDMYFAHFLRRRSTEQQTFELGSLMFLRVGKVAGFQGDLEDATVHYGQQAHVFDAIQFRFRNTLDRYFAVIPELQFLDEQERLTLAIRGNKTFVFPAFVRDMNVYNFSSRNASFVPPSKKAHLLIFSEDESLLAQRDIVLQEGDVFAAQERPDSLLSQPRVRKGFQLFYHPIFQMVAIGIGLTLIVGSSLIRRK